MSASLEAQIDRTARSSVVFAAIRGEDTVTIHAMGPADTATDRPATGDTIYELSSLSEVFTATAVMQLHERRLLDIDAPVSAYVPDLAIVNPFRRTPTIRHLMNHTSGLVDHRMASSDHREADGRCPPLARQVADAFAGGKWLRSEPGTRQVGSALGYLVLGRIVEVVSARRFDQYVHENILDPLEMTRSGFFGYDEITEDLADGHHGRKRAADRADLCGRPNTGMFGTGRDLARFVGALLGGGRRDGARILEQDTIRQMFALQHDYRGWAWPSGLGWSHGTIDHQRYYERIGDGARAVIRIYPWLDYGVVVLTNDDGRRVSKLSRWVVEPLASTAVTHPTR